MIFTEWKFLVFFTAAFTVYWNLRNNLWRKVWLLGCSITFYAAWDWRFLGIVLLVILNTYATTLLVHRNNRDALRRGFLTAGIVINLGALGVFKYYNFFVDLLAQIFSLDFTMRSIVLPIGISFYTFHSLSYMIDTYRRAIVPNRNFIDVALYIMFFPQLVAGPIVRATDLLPQMRETRSFGAVNFKFLLTLFLIGYFKKAIVSDNLSPLVDKFFTHPSQFGAGDAMLAVLSYATQIYCDFSGYTDMAIAIAGMLGYRLKPNFDHPYLAPNLIKFWRRWHMSLSFWLRDYLYIPLGGNRGGPLFEARNVMITMLLGGLWHGASWTFVAWGGLHGGGLIVCRVWHSLRRRYLPDYKPYYGVGANLITFTFVCFAWIFFRSPDFATAATVIDRFSAPALPTLLSWSDAAALAISLAAAHVLFYRIDLPEVLGKTNDLVFAFGYGVIAAAVLPFVNIAVQPFIYFQF